MRAQDQEPASTSRSQPRRLPTRATGPAPMALHPAMPLTPRAIPHLQRTVGNAAMARLIEAQRQQPHSRADGCEHDQPVQRSAVPDVLRSPGRPLDDDLRQEMQARLGADFSDVRLHTDTAAQRSAAEIGAAAYTSGNHIVAGADRMDKHTLAHELTHVIQQRRGPVPGMDTGTGLRVSHPDDSFEQAAEAAATRAMRGEAPVEPAPLDSGGGHDAVVQRAVGFEFEAGWKVRRVTDRSDQATQAHAAQARAYDQDWAGGPVLATVNAPKGDQAIQRWFPQHAEQLIDLARSSGPLVEQAPSGAGGPSRAIPSTAGLNWLETARNLDRNGYRQAVGEVNSTRIISGRASEPPLPGKSLDKHDVVIAGDGYALTADTTPSGGSQLEWVTQPLKDRVRVDQVMTEITTMATGLDGRKDEPEITADTITPSSGPGELVVYPDGKPLDFSPQATAGLALEQIARMVDYLTGTPATEHKDLFPADVTHIRQALGDARDRVHEAHGEGPGTDQLVGLVTLLGNYLEMAESIQHGGNTKTIAGVLMSRTDFAHNFRQLPEDIRTRYEKDPAAFAELVTGSENDTSPVFARRVERGSASQRTETKIRLTRHEWLTGIPTGIDRLKNLDNFTGDEIARLSVDQVKGSQATHDSLGKLGSVSDLVGPEDNQVTAVVAEFRRIKHGKRSADLHPLALNIFDLVTMINNGQPLPSAAPSGSLTPTNLDRGVLGWLADLLFACCARPRRETGGRHQSRSGYSRMPD